MSAGVRERSRPARTSPTSVRVGAALVVRGVWWRRWASVVLVLCAAITVAGAAIGPLWGRAAQASLLARALQEAPVSERAWIRTARTDSYASLGFQAPAAREVVDDVLDQGRLPAALGRWFDDPTERLSTTDQLHVVPARSPLLTEANESDSSHLAALTRTPLANLVAREGACAHVELVSGGCPEGRTDLLLSDRSAKALGVGAGDQVRVSSLRGTTFTVSGLYRGATVATVSRFWFDADDFRFQPLVTSFGTTVPAQLDAVLVQPELLGSVTNVPIQVQVEQVLRPGVITLANADRMERELLDFGVQLVSTSDTTLGSATAAQTVEGTVHGRQLVAGTASFVGLQIVVFGWVVLFGLVTVSVAAREGEMALVKLRGLRGPRLAAHALTEPVALVLLAVPLGLLGTWAAAGALAREVLLPGTPLSAPAGVWWGVGATVAGSLLACVLATRRSLRTPVADQLRRQSPQAGFAGPIATTVLLTLAGVGLVLVRTLGRGAPAALPALLTPVVVGLAAGLVMGLAVRGLLRVAVPRTRRWPLGPYLAVRQAARQASAAQVTALVTVATAVSGFAGGAYVVTASQREMQARLDVGAPRVVHVQPVDPTQLLTATRTVDPQGRWAMAAVQRGRGADVVLAVDSPRFGTAFGIDGGALARPRGLGELVPGGYLPPLTVKGRTATIDVASVDLDQSRSEVGVGLELDVVTSDGSVVPVPLGALGPKARRGGRFTAPVPDCVRGCTIRSVVVSRDGDQFGAVFGRIDLVSLTVGDRTYPFSVEQWQPTRTDPTMPDSAPTSSLTPGRPSKPGAPGKGVAMTFTAGTNVVPGLVRREVPTELPAILGARTRLDPIGTRNLVTGANLAGGILPVSIAGRSPVLPRAEAGVMVDLDLVSRIKPPSGSGLDFQVWLGRTAPADAPARLAASGLRVIEVESRQARRAELDRAEPARVQLLLLGTGGAALLAGVAGIATVLASAARRRAVESAALHAMAVPGRVVRGSAVLENVLLLLPGVLTGAVVAGLLVRVLAPVLAEVTGATEAVSGPPAMLDVVLPVLLAAAATVLLLIPVVLLVTRPAADETSMRVST